MGALYECGGHKTSKEMEHLALTGYSARWI